MPQYPHDRSPSPFPSPTAIFRPLILTGLSLLATAITPVVHGERILSTNWPQWRGPALNGTSDSKQLPTSWSETRNIKWKVAMPSWSGSTPIIWNNQIFVMSPSPAKEGENAPIVQGFGGKRPTEGLVLFLLCLSRTDGSEQWRHNFGAGNAHYGKQNMSSPSPVTDGKRVWAMTGTGLFVALDMEGHVQWQRDIQKEYGKFGQLWGYASSPLLHEHRLIIEVLHGMKTDDPSYLLAVDPETGKTLWKVDRPTDAIKESPDAYTSPTILRRNGQTEIIVSGGDYVTAHDPKTGAELWRCRGLNPDKQDEWRAVSSPLILDDLVFASVRRGPLVACRAGKQDNVAVNEPLWTSELAPDVPTPVSDGHYIYIVHDQGQMSCLDAKNGKPLYAKQRLPQGTYSSSPLLADGKLYVTSEDTRTTILATGPEFKILEENTLDSGYTLSSPAAAGPDLLIRTSKFLYCISNAAAHSQPSEAR